MAGEIKFLAFFAGGFAFVGCLLVNVYPEWLRNSQVSSEPFVSNLHLYHGIWWRCNTPRPGTFTCDSYDTSILGIRTDIQACRAMMCIACIFSFLGLVLSLLSLDCTTMVAADTKSKHVTAFVSGACFLIAADLQVQRALIIVALLLSLFGVIIGMATLRCTTLIDNESKFKSYFGIVSGACFFVSGVTCGAAVSWFAWRVTYEYFNPLYQNREFKYEYGACLYIGWVAMLFGVCAMIATVWFGVQVRNQFNDPNYEHNSFKYEYGSCLYIGWITAALSLISGLVLVVGSCMNMKKENRDAYYPTTTAYHPPSATTKLGNEKSEYV